MQKKSSLGLFLMLTLIMGLLLFGCSQKKPEKPTGDQAFQSEAAGPPESLETPVKAGDAIMEGRTSGPMLPIYFDFDSARIRDDQIKRLENNAKFLTQKPEVRIRIEGNCDPRGTREYNLALGERRAQSAKKYLVNLGIDPARLTTISWGEEKLLLFGHDELSWAQNRRDDFVIVK